MHPLIEIVLIVIQLFIYVLVASAVLSWLVAFNVINTQNRFVYTIGDFLFRVTEPALRQVRRYVPFMGGVDISPLVLILALILFEKLVVYYLA